MPAEWQARQLLLTRSEPGPSGNMRSLKGRSTVTDFNESLCSACAASGASTDTVKSATGNSLRHMFSSSGRDDGRLFDDVPHKPARVPVRRVGLRFAAAAGASDHQRLCSCCRRERELPLTEAVFAFVLSELRLLPALPAVAGEIDLRHAAVTAEGDAAGESWDAGPKPVPRLDVGDERTRYHSVDRH